MLWKGFCTVDFYTKSTKAMKHPKPSKASVKGKRPASSEYPVSSKKQKFNVSEVNFFCFLFSLHVVFCFWFILRGISIVF